MQDKLGRACVLFSRALLHAADEVRGSRFPGCASLLTLAVQGSVRLGADVRSLSLRDRPGVGRLRAKADGAKGEDERLDEWQKAWEQSRSARGLGGESAFSASAEPVSEALGTRERMLHAMGSVADSRERSLDGLGRMEFLLPDMWVRRGAGAGARC